MGRHAILFRSILLSSRWKRLRTEEYYLGSNQSF